MNRRISTLVTLALAGILLLAACAPAAPATVALTATPAAASPATKAAPTPVTLSLGYIPSVQFTPFYVAIKNGYFADENIEVKLENGIETDFLKLLGTNERQFVVASGEQAILGRSQGLPVTYVARWYRRFPVVVFSQAARNIKTPQDLIGKTVGIPGLFGASFVAWKALVDAANLPEDKITLKSIGFTQAAAVDQGLVDAALDYEVNGPVQLRLANKDANVIPVNDYRQIPANGLLTNEATIAAHPELVTSMVRAFLRGVRYTLDHPDEAFKISLEFVPEAAKDEATNRAVFDASLALWQPDPGQPLGVSDGAIWSQTADFMARTGLINQPVDTSAIWTNRFVEAASAP